MPKSLINGVNIYYESHGTGFPLILAHGLGGNAGEWRFQTTEFAEHYRTILWDMRGQGQSDSSPDPVDYGYAKSAEDLLGLLDHLEIGQAYVGGTSLGGGVVAHFAVNHPDRVAALLVFDSASAGGVPITDGYRGDAPCPVKVHRRAVFSWGLETGGCHCHGDRQRSPSVRSQHW